MAGIIGLSLARDADFVPYTIAFGYVPYARILCTHEVAIPFQTLRLRRADAVCGGE